MQPKPVGNTGTQVAIATAVGTTIEWYDFYIYSTAAALIFGKLFFPSFSPLVGTIAAFATFGVGFIARPIGGALFGHIGDRIGRKRALVATILFMGIGTCAIGLLPGYQTLGVAAPILLVLLRLLQGFAVGGEWGGAVLMATEYAPSGRRGLYASWPQIGAGLGLLLANGVFLLLRLTTSATAFSDWGWRVAFILSAILVIIGLMIRLRLDETPAFKQLQASGTIQKSPVVHVLRTAPRPLLLTAAVYLLNNTSFYISTAFALAYLASLKVASSVGLSAVMVGSILLTVFTVVFSALSDRYGRKRLIVSIYAFWFVWAFFMFFLLHTANPALIILAIGVATMLTAAYGPIGSFLPEQFSSNVRYSGVSVAVQISSIIGGGIGPIVAVLLNATYGIWAVSIYICVVALISIGATLALPETSQLSREEYDAVPSPSIAPQLAHSDS